jgi:hypothetical protein
VLKSELVQDIKLCFKLLCHVSLCVCVCLCARACTLLCSDLCVFHYYTTLALFVSCIGNKGGEVTGDSRKVHKVELNDIYCSPDI